MSIKTKILPELQFLETSVTGPLFYNIRKEYPTMTEEKQKRVRTWVKNGDDPWKNAFTSDEVGNQTNSFNIAKALNELVAEEDKSATEDKLTDKLGTC